MFPFHRVLDLLPFRYTFLKFSAFNLNAWNVHTDATTFAQVLVLALVLESEVLVLVLVLGIQVLVQVLGEKSLVTSLVNRPNLGLV